MNNPENRFPRSREGVEITEKEILQRLKLYHQTSKEKWRKIQEAGVLLSEKELMKRGLITKEQLEDFETTSTTPSDREERRDKYIFASHRPENYGEVTLEIDVDALNIEGTKVATAGDWLHFMDDEESKRYFRESMISGPEFVKYLTKFLGTLPDPEWFWTKGNSRVQELIAEGMMEKEEGNPEKIRQFWKLHPEIMFPTELPLKFVKEVTTNE